jgi:hypothetical protein
LVVRWRRIGRILAGWRSRLVAGITVLVIITTDNKKCGGGYDHNRD